MYECAIDCLSISISTSYREYEGMGYFCVVGTQRSRAREQGSKEAYCMCALSALVCWVTGDMCAEVDMRTT